MAKDQTGGVMGKYGYGGAYGAKTMATSPTKGCDSKPGQSGSAGTKWGVAKSPTKGKNA